MPPGVPVLITSQELDCPEPRLRRPAFAIVVESRLPGQLPLALSPPQSPRSAREGQHPKARAVSPSRPAPVTRRAPERVSVIALVRQTIEEQGEELVEEGEAPPEWLSPTKSDLRYGEVCIVRAPDGTRTLVRVCGYRAPQRDGEKRPYRRWFGLDLLAFLRGGVRREVRIASVLKGSRC
jgi:hypothetical protein